MLYPIFSYIVFASAAGQKLFPIHLFSLIRDYKVLILMSLGRHCAVIHIQCCKEHLQYLCPRTS